jgi:FixJ family two-component response regulator
MDTRPEQLLDAIAVVTAGEALVHPRVTKRPIERFAELPRPRRTPDDDLTERERAVLLAVAQGLSNQEVAAQLHLALRHRQGPRQPPPHQAGLPRPRAAGDARLRVRVRRPG